MIFNIHKNLYNNTIIQYTMKLIDIYTFWFESPQLWFNSTPENDDIIKEKFGYLFNEQIKLPDPNTEYIESIAYILLYDQITRHVNRNNPDTIQMEMDKIVLFAKDFYSINQDKLNPNEFCFVLLPLRHTKIYDNCMFVLKETWKKIDKSNVSDKPIYTRFLKATYDRFIIDESTLIEEHMPIKVGQISENLHKILDKRCLEYARTELKMYGHSEVSLEGIDKTKTYILSLSGGVDSMVTSYLLKTEGVNFVGVHISYENRKECEDEVEVLKEWCGFLDVKFFVRRIHEINRKQCMEHNLRTTYEDYTRNVRFNSYKIVRDLLNLDETRVILGHNKDDSFENILTNITSQSHYENLIGMSIVQKLSGIEFYRPLLNFSKREIYEIAYKMKIPHFSNSTPEWSQRGKIRDKVRPVLEEWNASSINGLFKLSMEMGSYIKFIEDTVNKVNDEMNIKGFVKFEIHHIPMIEYYWSYLFKKNNLWISTKSIANWLEKLKHIQTKFYHIDINHVSKVNLNKHTKIYIKKIDRSGIEIKLVKYY